MNIFFFDFLRCLTKTMGIYKGMWRIQKTANRLVDGSGLESFIGNKKNIYLFFRIDLLFLVFWGSDEKKNNNRLEIRKTARITLSGDTT